MARYNCFFGARSAEVDVRQESGGWVSTIHNGTGWGLAPLVIDAADTEQKALSATVAAIERKWGVQYTGCQKVDG